MAQTRWGGRLVAEFVGTFALVFVGVMAIYNLRHDGGAGLVGIALAHGLTIAALVSATMSISGGHLNPAVTFAVWAGRQMRGADALAYVCVQLAGGLLGGWMAMRMGADILAGTPQLANVAAGAASDVSVLNGLLIEAVLTFLLVFVVYGTGIDPRFGGRVGGLAIGFAVTLDILAGGPLTGAAMNPARWFGAALPAGHLGPDAIVYTLGPLLGAAAAALVYTSWVMPRKDR